MSEWNNLSLDGMKVVATTEKGKKVAFTAGTFEGYEMWVPLKLIKGEGAREQISFTNEFNFTLSKSKLNPATKTWEKTDERQVTGAEFAEHYAANAAPKK